MLFLLWYYLTRTCWASFGPVACSSLNWLQWPSMVIGFILMILWAFLPITLLMGSFGPFLSPWASLAHLHSLGILGPFSNSAFSWAFTNSFGLPWSNYLILHLWGSWASHQLLTFLLPYFGSAMAHSYFFLHHIMLISLLLLSLGSSRPICFPQDSFIYFMSLWSIIPIIWA